MPSIHTSPALPQGASAAQSAKRVRALRTSLISELSDHLRALLSDELKQGALAQELGLSRPRLNQLLNKKVELFSLDSLTGIAARAGLTVRLTVARPYRRSAR